MTCAWMHGGVALVRLGKQVCVSLFRSSRKPILAVVGLALEEYATIALLVSGSTPIEYANGVGVNVEGISPAKEIVNG